MPYRIDKRGNEYCVVKRDGGEVKKCYPDRSPAIRYLVALEAATANEKADSPTFFPGHVLNTSPTIITHDGPSRKLHILGAPFYGPEDGKDSNRTYFSPKTNFLLDYPPHLPTIWYNHGTVYDDTNREPLGVATRRWLDDNGVWFEFQLNQDNPLHKQLWEEALTGNLYASSGAIPASRVVEGDGHIAQWHIGEVSILPLVPATGQRPVNMYAVALPQLMSALDSLNMDEVERLGTLYGQKEGIMSWLEELRTKLGAVLDTLDRVPKDMTMGGCADCPASTPVMSQSGVSTPPATPSPVADPRISALEQQIKALAAVQAQAEDGAWINGVLATGQLQQGEVSHVMSLLSQARAANPTLVDNIRSMVTARPVVATQAAGVMGFSSPQRVEGGGVETPPSDEYMNKLRRLFNRDDRVEVK